MRTFRVAFFQGWQQPFDALVCVDDPRPLLQVSQPMPFASCALAIAALQRVGCSLDTRIVADSASLDRFASEPGRKVLISPPMCGCPLCQAATAIYVATLPLEGPGTGDQGKAAASPEKEPAPQSAISNPQSPISSLLGFAQKILAWVLANPLQPAQSKEAECYGK